MTPQHPPGLATALLKHLGPENKALTGDLFETYHAGRSSAWYWRQAIAAIIIGNLREIWNHRRLAIRAMALGWSATYVLGRVSGIFLTAALPSSTFYFHSTSRSSLLAFMFNAMVVVGILQTALVRVCTGWIVARCHRPYQASMVFAFLASFLILDLPWLFRSAIDAADVGGMPVVAMFTQHLVSVIVTVTCVMMGLAMSGRGTRDQIVHSAR